MYVDTHPLYIHTHLSLPLPSVPSLPSPPPLSPLPSCHPPVPVQLSVVVVLAMELREHGRSLSSAAQSKITVSAQAKNKAEVRKGRYYRGNTSRYITASVAKTRKILISPSVSPAQSRVGGTARPFRRKARHIPTSSPGLHTEIHVTLSSNALP